MTRAISPVIGTVLLVLITIVLAGALTATVGTGAIPDSGPDFVAISADASPDGTVTVSHDSGESIDVRDVRVRVAVDGTRLDHQPPVPFFSTVGFEPGPTGPFNSAADPNWSAGERASVTVSDTNSPTLDPGDEIVVELYDGKSKLATARTTVSASGSG